MEKGRHEGLRIDRWLWCARFFKSRSAAAQAVLGGHVKVNGKRVKAAREVRSGDRLRIVRNSQIFDVWVRAIPSHRGPAAAAARLYEEDPESIARRDQEQARRRQTPPQVAPTPDRPDRRTRRLLRARQRGPLSPWER